MRATGGIDEVALVRDAHQVKQRGGQIAGLDLVAGRVGTVLVARSKNLAAADAGSGKREAEDRRDRRLLVDRLQVAQAPRHGEREGDGRSAHHRDGPEDHALRCEADDLRRLQIHRRIEAHCPNRRRPWFAARCSPHRD